tara:strand:- start:203 stop:562 length:360 start_codon:yes stop_codon:yes gene_type:complete
MTELIDYTIDGLENLKGTNPEGADIHHEIFNTDYYIIGTYEAKKWIEKIGTFDVIGEIVDYETLHFGEVTTDTTNPEKVANMYAYIKGEEILSDSKILQGLWDEQLNDGDLQGIINELN